MGGYCDAHAVWTHVAVRDRLFEFITDSTDASTDDAADAVGTDGDQSAMERHRRIVRAGQHAAISTAILGGDNRAQLGYGDHRDVAVRLGRTHWNPLRELYFREQRVGPVFVGHR